MPSPISLIVELSRPRLRFTSDVYIDQASHCAPSSGVSLPLARTIDIRHQASGLLYASGVLSVYHFSPVPDANRRYLSRELGCVSLSSF